MSIKADEDFGTCELAQFEFDKDESERYRVVAVVDNARNRVSMQTAPSRFQVRKPNWETGEEEVVHEFGYNDKVIFGRDPSKDPDVELTSERTSRFHGTLSVKRTEISSRNNNAFKVSWDDDDATNPIRHNLDKAERPIRQSSRRQPPRRQPPRRQDPIGGLDSYTSNLIDGDRQARYEEVTRDSEINNHVSRHSTCEDIVVDDKEAGHSEQYNELYAKLVEKLGGEGNMDVSNLKKKALNAAYDTVLEWMSYDKEFVDKMSDDASNGEINLSEYIKQRKGVCRHMGIAVAYLLERLKRENPGTITGTVTYKRTMGLDARGNRGGHGWTSYENSGGEIRVLDVAQGFIGRLEKALETKAGRFYREIYR